VRAKSSRFNCRSTGFCRLGFRDRGSHPNGGLILIRESDERLGFGELIEQYLTDSRASHARFSFADLLRQSVYSRLAGYQDVNDAERLSQDPRKEKGVLGSAQMGVYSLPSERQGVNSA